MEDLEITNLVYRSVELIDSGKLESAAQLFHDAQVKLSEDGTYLNRQELLSYWQHKFSPDDHCKPSWRHLITNPIVEVDTKLNTASCRSNYCVLQLGTLQTSESGQFFDQFVKQQGQWRFTARQYLNIHTASNITINNKPSVDLPKDDTHSPIKAKIIAAAQHIFSTVGYSDAGIRKIAEAVGVAPTILFRHFGTKANLFEVALTAALKTSTTAVDKSVFGRHVATLLADPSQPNCPHAMSLLATGNEEAREIAIRVLKEQTLTPMMQWLGPPHAESRTREIMALCAGFALYNVQLNTTGIKAIDAHMVDWLAKSIQAAVDEQ